MDDSIIIEDNIPIPKDERGRGTTKYPWLKLKIGQSFLVRNGAPKNMASQAGNTSRRYHPRQFIARKVDGGVRVWRIADRTNGGPPSDESA